MDFAKKNDFVVKHTNIEFFNKDKEHFMKVFPYSPLVAELKKANQYNKKALQGRILLELLNNVCPESILEYRGLKKTTGTTPIDEKAEAQKELLNTPSLDDISLTRKKGIVKLLDLSVENEKAELIDTALNEYIKAFQEPTTKESTLNNNDAKLPEDVQNVNTELRETKNIEDIPYARKREMVNLLDLALENNKQSTYDAALTQYMSSGYEFKKKEARDPNTQTSTGN